MSFSLCQSISVCYSLSLSASLSLSYAPCLSFSFFLSLSLFLSVPLFLSHSLSLALCLSLSISLSLSLSGDNLTRDKKSVQSGTLNPDFFSFYEFTTSLPGPSLLKVWNSHCFQSCIFSTPIFRPDSLDWFFFKTRILILILIIEVICIKNIYTLILFLINLMF